VRELATGKSPEPAGWKACAAQFDFGVWVNSRQRRTEHGNTRAGRPCHYAIFQLHRKRFGVMIEKMTNKPPRRAATIWCHSGILAPLPGRERYSPKPKWGNHFRNSFKIKPVGSWHFSAAVGWVANLRANRYETTNVRLCGTPFDRVSTVSRQSKTKEPDNRFPLKPVAALVTFFVDLKRCLGIKSPA